jgi:hypothetical protein
MRDIAGAQILDARDLSKINVAGLGDKALQRYTLHSILDIPAGGGAVTSLPFFSTPQGGTQTVGAVALTMDRSRTNITKANAISTPNAYILKAIRLWVQPKCDTYAFVSADIADAMQILGEGYFKLVFGEREHFIIAPPMMLSSGMGLEGFGGGGTTTDIIVPSNSHPLIFKVEPWVLIPSELNFQASLEYPTARTNIGKVRVGLIFDGDLIRNVA